MLSSAQSVDPARSPLSCRSGSSQPQASPSNLPTCLTTTWTRKGCPIPAVGPHYERPGHGYDRGPVRQYCMGTKHPPIEAVGSRLQDLSTRSCIVSSHGWERFGLQAQMLQSQGRSHAQWNRPLRVDEESALGQQGHHKRTLVLRGDSEGSRNTSCIHLLILAFLAHVHHDQLCSLSA